jgi:hypothetical protein
MASAPPDKNGSKTARDEKGRFMPGNAGGPGRPTSEFSITELLRAEIQARPKLVKRWADLMESEDENVALRAITSAANRIDGMPKQSAEVEHKGSLNVGLVWHDGEEA